METLKEALMRRDSLSAAEADSLIVEAREEVASGVAPERVLEEMFGLEPDYVMDLL